MRTREKGFALHDFVNRVLEGRVSSLQCIVCLGSFATIVLLYISLHVSFFNVSNELAAANERVEALLEHNVRLMARYNELASPGAIIPRARELGMRPGSGEEVQRFAVGGGRGGRGEPSWAEAGVNRLFEFGPQYESRMSR